MTASTWNHVCWKRHKLNPTIAFDVESGLQRNDNENQTNKSELISRLELEENRITTVEDISIADLPSGRMRRPPYQIILPRLLQKYFGFMHNLGILPSKYDGKKTSRIKCVLQQTLFWTFSILSVIDSVKLIKYFSVGYVHKGNLYRYTVMSYMLLKAYIRLAFLYLMVCNQYKIVKLQNIIEAVNKMINVANKGPPPNKQEKLILICIWTLTFAGSFLATIFSFASMSSGWSIEDTVARKSYQLSQVMFIWTSNMTEVDIREDVLYDEYGNMMSYTTALLGACWAVLELFGRIYDNAVTDVLLLIAFTMYKLNRNFRFEMTEPTEFEDHAKVVWGHYKQLQTISEEVDSTFGNFFKWVHFANLNTCAYYVQLLTVEGILDVNLLLLTLSIVKIAVAYVVAAKASSKNKAFRKWTQQTYREQPYIAIGVRRLQTSVVLDELTTNLIGLGSDNFHVDESFIMKFLGFVASYFLFLSQSIEKSS